MSDLIESTSNSKVKELVKLRESSKKRKENGFFMVEGFADLMCLIVADREIAEIYFCRELVEKSGLKTEIEIMKNQGFLMVEMFKEPFLKSLVSQKFGWLFSKGEIMGIIN